MKIMEDEERERTKRKRERERERDREGLIPGRKTVPQYTNSRKDGTRNTGCVLRLFNNTCPLAADRADLTRLN